MSDVSQIDGSAIRLKRESQGWAVADLASRACLSVKQIRQIEEGGMTAFYSETVKLTAARKVAGLLQMSETQLFGQQVPVVEPPEEETLLHASAHVASPDLSGAMEAAPAANALLRGEALHELAQPPEHVDVGGADEAVVATLPEPQPPEAPAPQPVQEAAAPAEPAGNGYLLKIVALFLVALAAAALLRPQVMDHQAEPPAAAQTPAPPELSPSTDVPAPAEAAAQTNVAEPALVAPPATPAKPATEAKPVLEVKPAVEAKPVPEVKPAAEAKPAVAPASAPPASSN